MWCSDLEIAANVMTNQTTKTMGMPHAITTKASSSRPTLPKFIVVPIKGTAGVRVAYGCGVASPASCGPLVSTDFSTSRQANLFPLPRT